MLFSAAMQDANKTALSLWQASLENLRATQETMVRQGELAARMENPWKVKWSGGPVTMPTLAFQPGETDVTREAFHVMADANLKAWEVAAEAYAAMPGWSKLPYKAPGEFWSKWFDQFNSKPAPAPSASPASKIAKDLVAEAKETLKAAEQAVEAATPHQIADPKPVLLSSPTGDADDLTQIKGIGPKLQQSLNDFGIFHFTQIADWTPENIAWLDETLSFKGRIQREGWVEQARNFLSA